MENVLVHIYANLALPNKTKIELHQTRVIRWSVWFWGSMPLGSIHGQAKPNTALLIIHLTFINILFQKCVLWTVQFKKKCNKDSVLDRCPILELHRICKASINYKLQQIG